MLCCPGLVPTQLRLHVGCLSESVLPSCHAYLLLPRGGEGSAYHCSGRESHKTGGSTLPCLDRAAGYLCNGPDPSAR